VTEDQIRDQRITAMGLLAEAYTGLAARLSAQTAQHDLAPVEFEVLLRLARSPNGRLRMTDLSAQTGITTSGITRVIDRLDRHGLVCREACPTDRRSSYAVITAKGRARLDAVLPGHLELIDEWFTGRLAPDHLTAVLAGLRVVRDAVRPGAVANALSAEAPEH
jgi:DNA-binding MarR family transcriptional regulator